MITVEGVVQEGNFKNNVYVGNTLLEEVQDNDYDDSRFQIPQTTKIKNSGNKIRFKRNLNHSKSTHKTPKTRSISRISFVKPKPSLNLKNYQKLNSRLLTKNPILNINIPNSEKPRIIFSHQITTQRKKNLKIQKMRKSANFR